MRIVIVIMLMSLLVGLFVLGGCGTTDSSNNQRGSGDRDSGPEDDQQQNGDSGIPSPPPLPEG